MDVPRVWSNSAAAEVLKQERRLARGYDFDSRMLKQDVLRR
jgi:hypothetical protein